MKAMVLRGYDRPLQVEEVDKPTLGPDEVLVKVAYCGICGTDLKILEGKLADIVKLPHIPGHEIAGTIVEIGSKVKDLKVGDLGIVYPYVSCRDCELCRTGQENICFDVKRFGFELKGGFAEYVGVPAYNFCKVEGSMESLKNFAVLTDAAATPYHALKRIARVTLGQKVLIIGAGGLGLHGVQIAKLLGAQVAVVDIREENRSLAKKFGAELVMSSIDGRAKKEILLWTGGKGVDVVLEGVGSPSTFQGALSCLKRGGSLVIMGYDPSTPLSVNGKDMHYNEWKVFGTRLSTKQELLELISLSSQGSLKPVVTMSVAMEEANRGMEILREGNTPGRIVLTAF
ncbi:MAG: alcohol dehydrogenase catalytic domain-containing protein [Spirochaetes bacterium]|nr:alcohol dehydrogenase catalytic domain-containing protein [Spirochaetota bacterium]